MATKTRAELQRENGNLRREIAKLEAKLGPAGTDGAPAPMRQEINPAAVKDWSSRILAVRTHLQQISAGADRQLAEIKGSLAAQLESVESEMGAAATAAGQ